jgi:ElaB/YqjD/DUF883 family membrane-anchored ribosome-binding protein
MTQRKHMDDWPTLKSKMKERWSKLTDADLKKIMSLEHQLAELLEKKYRFTKKEALRKAEDFFNRASSDIHSDYHHQVSELKDTISEMTNGLIERITDTKDRIPEYAHELAEEGEEKIMDTVKSHPLSTLGVVAAAGFILGSIIKK